MRSARLILQLLPPKPPQANRKQLNEFILTILIPSLLQTFLSFSTRASDFSGFVKVFKCKHFEMGTDFSGSLITRLLNWIWTGRGCSRKPASSLTAGSIILGIFLKYQELER
jgi:hypothetical protein